MPKSRIVGSVWRSQERRPAELPSAVEGQIVEICRDLAVQSKRMRQLQEQADELQAVIREWSERRETESSPDPLSRGGRR